MTGVMDMDVVTSESILGIQTRKTGYSLALTLRVSHQVISLVILSVCQIMGELLQLELNIMTAMELQVVMSGCILGVQPLITGYNLALTWMENPKVIILVILSVCQVMGKLLQLELFIIVMEMEVLVDMSGFILGFQPLMTGCCLGLTLMENQKEATLVMVSACQVMG